VHQRLEVVECDDLVVHRQVDVGGAEGVGVVPGDVLDQPDRVVAEEADRPPQEAGQLGGVDQGGAGDDRPEHVPDVRVVHVDPSGPRAGPVLHLDVAAPGADQRGRLRADEAVAGEPLTAFDRLEQERVAAAIAQPEPDRDGRVEVGGQGADAGFTPRLGGHLSHEAA